MGLHCRHVSKNLNIGDAIDYGQRLHKGSMGDVVIETLNVLEVEGGPDAFLNIKWVSLPDNWTYEGLKGCATVWL